MAGLGRKVWSAGDTLTAADVNGYLMDQTVMVFAGTAARASAIPTPSAGMVAYSTATGLELYNGSAWGAVGGKVFQVVSTVKTDTFSTSSNVYSDITGLSVSVTPSATSSKILVLFTVQVTSSASTAAAIKLLRGSTDIFVGDAAGSRTPASVGSFTPYGPTSSGIYLDSPNTTSATTYKIQLRANDNAAAAYINRSATDSDSALFSRTASSITVMEIIA